MTWAVEAKGVGKVFGGEAEAVEALRDIDLTLSPGDLSH